MSWMLAVKTSLSKNWNEAKLGSAFLGLSLFLLGGWLSLRLTFSIFPIEPDAIHSLILWQEVQANGIAWLRHWLFTQDNWLLSLIPLHFMLFWAFGPIPDLLILSGWLSFISSVVVSGFIARGMGARRAGIIVPVILVYMGLFAHLYGYASYSNSHNLSNLFGLLALLVLLRWLKGRRHWLLGLIAFLHITGGISDPWLLPAYTLPFLLVSGIYALVSGSSVTRAHFRALFCVMPASLILIKTQLFGLLDFLPVIHYRIADLETVVANAVYLIRDLGGLFNLIPGHSGNALPAALMSLLLLVAVLGLSVNACLRRAGNPFQAVQASTADAQHEHVASAYGGRSGLAGKIPGLASLTDGLRGLDPASAVIIFSCAAMIAAFTLSSVPAQDFSARFLLNFFYLAIIALTVFLDAKWELLSAALRFAWITITLLFVISGLTSTLSLSASASFRANDQEIVRLAQFLAERGLNYGYGTYWSSHANAVTALSDSKIRIRPVMFATNGRMYFGRPQSSSLWSHDDDFPTGQSRFFVILAEAMEKDQCREIRLCIEGLTRQFGASQKVLHFDRYTILVWQRPLIGQFHRIAQGQLLRFDQSGDPPFGMGWSRPESWGTWTVDERAEVRLEVTGPIFQDLELVVTGKAFLGRRSMKQDVDVLVNDRLLETWQFDSRDPVNRSVRVPKSMVADNGNRFKLTFLVRRPMSPSRFGSSDDGRRLGLGVISLQLRAVGG